MAIWCAVSQSRGPGIQCSHTCTWQEYISDKHTHIHACLCFKQDGVSGAHLLHDSSRHASRPSSRVTVRSLPQNPTRQHEKSGLAAACKRPKSTLSGRLSSLAYRTASIGRPDLCLGGGPPYRNSTKRAHLVPTASTVTPAAYSQGPAIVTGKGAGQPHHGQLQAQLISQYRRETVVHSPELRASLEISPWTGSAVETSLAPQASGRTSRNWSARRATGFRWEAMPVKEIKANTLVLTPDDSRCGLTLTSEEPYHDAIRPMSASKRFQENVKTSRKGGVFRTSTVRSRSLRTRGDSVPSAIRQEEEDLYDEWDLENPFICLDDHDQVMRSSHNWSIDSPAKLPVAPALTAIKSPLSSRAASPAANSRSSSALHGSITAVMTLAVPDSPDGNEPSEAARHAPEKRAFPRSKSLSPLPSSLRSHAPPERPRTGSPMLGHPSDVDLGLVNRPCTPTVHMPSVAPASQFSPEAEEGRDDEDSSGEGSPDVSGSNVESGKAEGDAGGEVGGVREDAS